MIVKTRNSLKIYITFYKSKLPLFHIFCQGHESNFLKKQYVHQGKILIFDIFIKFSSLAH